MIDTNEMRINKIAGLIKNGSKEKTAPINFDKENHSCQLIKVDENLLLYRLDNTRTLAAQKEFIASQNLPSDYFSNDRIENSDQQTKQGELLDKFLMNDDYKNLKESFDIAGGQTEAILINKYGHVINGNRRLAFMRREKRLTVECQIIPSHIEDRYLEVEARLDIAVDTRVKYDWISIGLSMLKLRKENKKDSEISAYKSIGINEVKITMRATEIAIESLEMRGQKDQFSLLKNSEQIYKETAKSVDKKNNVDPQENLARKLSVTLVDLSSENIHGNRKYNLQNEMLKNPDCVLRVLNKNLNSNDAKESKDSIFDDGDNKAEFFDLEEFKKVISDPQNNQNIIDEITTEIKEEINDKNDTGSDNIERKKLVNLSRASLKNIDAALLNYRDDSETDGLATLLLNIEETIKKIRKKTED